MGFRHVHVCMNDYPFPCVWIFVMHISVRMTIHFFFNGFFSWTFLYKWLPFLFEWIVVIYISVRMTTISFWMYFRHARFCANDYHFVVYGFSSCIFCANDFPYSCIWIFVIHISVRRTIHFFWMGFRHAHSCTNDYPFLVHGFSSCTFLYEWLSISFEWGFDVCNALQRVNSMVQWRFIKDIIMYIGFAHKLDTLQ